MKTKCNKIYFLQILKEAVSNVATSYQSVEVMGLSAESDKEVARERVYCYELYHQLRLIVGNLFYDVNGEIDKRGHEIITEGFNPDIIIHKQGSMEYNELVVEAKAKWNSDGVKKDFNTLSKMTTDYKYNLGVFLFIGKCLSEIKEKLLLLKDEIANSEKIYIICVEGDKIETCTLTSIFEEGAVNANPNP